MTFTVITKAHLIESNKKPSFVGKLRSAVDSNKHFFKDCFLTTAKSVPTGFSFMLISLIHIYIYMIYNIPNKPTHTGLYTNSREAMYTG